MFVAREKGYNIPKPHIYASQGSRNVEGPSKRWYDFKFKIPVNNNLNHNVNKAPGPERVFTLTPRYGKSSSEHTPETRRTLNNFPEVLWTHVRCIPVNTGYI